MNALTKQIYTDGYYQTAFEVQRGIGTGWTLNTLNEDEIAKVLSRPWTTDERTFSDRIWTNKDALVNSVNTHLTQMIIRGESAAKATNAIAKDMKTSKYRAGRIVMTESAHFSVAAQKDCFTDLGVERYQWIASLDANTCEICAGMDNKVFTMPQYEEGVTAPPAHPWCRCCTAPYFEDMAGLGDRAARDADGNSITVPRNMTYAEWKKKFVVEPTEEKANKRKEMSDKIIGVKLPNGETVKGVSDHLFDRLDERGLTLNGVKDALENPLHITEAVVDKHGRPSRQFIGREATVAYNPVENKAVTTWKTGKAKFKKYGGDKT
jgi:SPP1 gp7 family putative phage head morphogenesis protein